MDNQVSTSVSGNSGPVRFDAPPNGIYQPLFNEAVGQYLDPGFLALDWLHNPHPALRELALHRHILQARLFEKHKLTGLFSPKFFAKTGLTSSDVNDWINQNPRHELYCFDGRPFVPYTFYNSVERAARSHPPDFEGRLRRVCSAIGFELPVELDRQTTKQTIHCNYWCASAGFWERWGREIVFPIFQLAQSDPSLAREVFCVTPYRSRTPVFLITFIYERIMSYYIQTKGIDAAMFSWSPERIIDLRCPPSMRDYLVRNLPWIDEIDSRGYWTPEDRAKLTAGYDELVRQAPNMAAHEGNVFDPLNFDLPACKPPILKGKRSARR